MERKNSIRLNAKKGEKYPIKIEYMQRTGSADLNFTVGVRTPVDFQATASKVKDADVIVFVGGISPRLEGEEMPVDAEGFRKGDRTNIEIPAVQKEMVKALVATGKPVVYVVCTGSALALNWENDHVNAILNVGMADKKVEQPWPTFYSETITRPDACRSRSINP